LITQEAVSFCSYLLYGVRLPATEKESAPSSQNLGKPTVCSLQRR